MSDFPKSIHIKEEGAREVAPQNGSRQERGRERERQEPREGRRRRKGRPRPRHCGGDPD